MSTVITETFRIERHVKYIRVFSPNLPGFHLSGTVPADVFASIAPLAQVFIRHLLHIHVEPIGLVDAADFLFSGVVELSFSEVSPDFKKKHVLRIGGSFRAMPEGTFLFIPAEDEELRARLLKEMRAEWEKVPPDKRPPLEPWVDLEPSS